MADEAQLTITRAILHVTSRKGYNASKGVFEPKGAVAEFLADHITRRLKDSSLRSCAFVDPAPSQQPVGTWLTEAATASDTAFVARTTSAAKAMHDTLTGNPSLSDGSLVIVSYHYGNPERGNLALLKMDPGPAFAAQSNQPVNTISRRGEMLPSTRERLHKCAFLEWHGDGDDAAQTLSVLDLQRDRPGQIREWFLRDYLHAKLALDDFEMTARFYSTALNASTRIDDESRKRNFQTALDGAISQKRVDIRQFLDDADLQDEERSQIDKRLVAQLGENRSFVVDGAAREKAQAIVRFRGDQDLSLRAKVTVYRNHVIEIDAESGEAPPEIPEQQTRYRIIIDTDTWTQH